MRTLEAIVTRAADHFMIDADDIRGDARDPEFSMARALVAKMGRECGYTYEEIGGSIGKHHSSIIAAAKRLGSIPAYLMEWIGSGTYRPDSSRRHRRFQLPEKLMVSVHRKQMHLPVRMVCAKVCGKVA